MGSECDSEAGWNQRAVLPLTRRELHQRRNFKARSRFLVPFKDQSVGFHRPVSLDDFIEDQFGMGFFYLPPREVITISRFIHRVRHQHIELRRVDEFIQRRYKEWFLRLVLVEAISVPPYPFWYEPWDYLSCVASPLHQVDCFMEGRRLRGGNWNIVGKQWFMLTHDQRICSWMPAYPRDIRYSYTPDRVFKRVLHAPPYQEPVYFHGQVVAVDLALEPDGEELY